jgi:KDO2-lipid IV(A) lauroyltransferase
MRYRRPFNLVMAREANETTAAYVRKAREDAGLRILLSDTSVFGSFNMLRALRRNEIVALQLDRPLDGEGRRLVPFFGAPAAFQSGALRLARLAGAPIIPVFVAQHGIRHYRIILGSERVIARAATQQDLDLVLASIIAEFENLVRQHPEQWFQFTPFWPEDAPPSPPPAVLDGSQPAERARTGARAR